MAKQEGLTEELVAMIDEGFEESGLSPSHKVLLRYADAFLVDPGRVDESVRRDMLQYYTPAQIVELTVCLALCMGFSKIAIALGQTPASMPMTVVPTPDWPGVESAEPPRGG